MQSKWLVFGGWSLPPDILSPVFSNEATYVDVNKLFLDIIAEKRLKDTWVEIISDKTAHLIAKAPVCIAGWSTGAFFAYALSDIVKPQKMILLSASPSFCKRDGFIHGQDSGVIKVMRRQLTRNKLSVLENFQKQCGLDQYNGHGGELLRRRIDLRIAFSRKNKSAAIKKTFVPDTFVSWKRRRHHSLARPGNSLHGKPGQQKLFYRAGMCFFLMIQMRFLSEMQLTTHKGSCNVTFFNCRRSVSKIHT